MICSLLVFPLFFAYLSCTNISDHQSNFYVGPRLSNKIPTAFFFFLHDFLFIKRKKKCFTLLDNIEKKTSSDNADAQRKKQPVHYKRSKEIDVATAQRLSAVTHSIRCVLVSFGQL